MILNLLHIGSCRRGQIVFPLHRDMVGSHQDQVNVKLCCLCHRNRPALAHPLFQGKLIRRGPRPLSAGLEGAQTYSVRTETMARKLLGIKSGISET